MDRFFRFWSVRDGRQRKTAQEIGGNFQKNGTFFCVCVFLGVFDVVVDLFVFFAVLDMAFWHTFVADMKQSSDDDFAVCVLLV